MDQRNTRVNAFKNMSLQKSFSTVSTSVSFDGNLTQSHTRNTTISSPPWLNQSYIDSVTIQGITYTFGEYYYGTSGVAIGQWRNTSESTTSNCQLYIRMDITTGQSLQPKDNI